jgi:hypothetical protein
MNHIERHHATFELSGTKERRESSKERKGKKVGKKVRNKQENRSWNDSENYLERMNLAYLNQHQTYRTAGPREMDQIHQMKEIRML